MAGFSIYLAQALINWLLRAQAMTPPADCFLAFFIADPTDANITSNEVSAGWYVRQDIGAFSAPVGSGTSTNNSNQLSFSPVTGGSVTVTHWGIYDAVSGGNLLISGAFPAAKVLNVDDVPVVNANELVLDFQ